MLDILDFLSYGVTLLWCVVLSVHIVALIRAKTYLFKAAITKSLPESHCYGVSIVKTVIGYTPEFMVNLESVFCLDYPKFEVVICVQDEDSTIIPYVEDLVKKHPNVDSRIFKGAENVGVNPKINNMLQCYGDLKYNHIWICDSNIKVRSHLLTELTSHLNENVGMVHQLPFIDLTRNGYGPTLEKIYFGTHHARWYLFFNTFNILCANGMSSLINKSYLDQYGGLKAFVNYIAEDHFMAKTLYDNGYQVILSTEPAYQNPSIMTYSNFVNRMTRWQILRLTMLPTGFLEPLIENVLLGLIFSCSINHILSIDILTTFIIHTILWMFSDILLLRTIEQKFYSTLCEMLCGWLFREWSTYYIFLKAVFSRKIVWNKGSFDIKFGGSADFVPKTENKNV